MKKFNNLDYVRITSSGACGTIVEQYSETMYCVELVTDEAKQLHGTTEQLVDIHIDDLENADLTIKEILEEFLWPLVISIIFVGSIYLLATV